MFTLPKYTWDKDRETCKKCKHYREQPRRHGYYGQSVGMLCAVNPYKGTKGIGTCIDNRTRGPCGEAASLFEPIGSVSLMAIQPVQPRRPRTLVQEESPKEAMARGRH